MPATGDAPAPVHDGWFETGDAGLVNHDGSIRILGRTSDMIITGGEKVVPSEVESALESLPGIREALVVGMPDEKWGQIVTALLVSDTDPHPQSDAIVCGLAARLARWKSPRRIAWVSSLPFTSAGKRSRNPRGSSGPRIRCSSLQTLNRSPVVIRLPGFVSSPFCLFQRAAADICTAAARFS